MTGRVGAIAAWATDFLRAARERPWWARLALPRVLGRYAYRELIGLQDELVRGGHDPYFGYGAEECTYQNDKVPHAWWLRREPKPLKEPAAPIAPVLAPSLPSNGPALLDKTVIAELVGQHNTHTARENQALSKLNVLDSEFVALANVALPHMVPEQAAQFHAWNYRRQMVIEEINEAVEDRKADFDRLYAELGRHYGG
jgi:hypothetical protein